MKKIISIILGTVVALNLSLSVVNAAACLSCVFNIYSKIANERNGIVNFLEFVDD
jgi:hypothetical protein